MSRVTEAFMWRTLLQCNRTRAWMDTDSPQRPKFTLSYASLKAGMRFFSALKNGVLLAALSLSAPGQTAPGMTRPSMK
jgi:hypothetical protein